MKSNTKSMILTLVLVFMSSVSWGQDDADKCAELKVKSDELEAKVNSAKATCGANNACPAAADLISKFESAKSSYLVCEKSSERSEKSCKEISDRIKERETTFGYAAQKKALECMEGGSTTEADTTRGILVGLGATATMSPSDTCMIKGTKNNYQDQLQKEMTAIERLEKEIKAIDEKIVAQKKRTTDELAGFNEDRIKLKEAWEKRQTEQEAEQARALNAMRENQIKVQEAIRKANAELINARQDMAKAERKRSEELLKAGVQSFSSMSRICNAQVKDYYKKAELNKKKKSGSLGSALGKGSSKKKDLQSFMDDCLKSMEEKRNAIYEDTSNYLVQMVNNIKDRQESISTLENEYKNQADSYKKAIEREASALSKDQQAFLQKDQNLANKISQYQQNAAQEANDLLQQKMRIQQSLSAAINSKGEISIEESKEGIEKLSQHMGDVRLLAGKDYFDKNGDPVPGKEPKCRAEFERFKSQIKEFKSHTERMTDLQQ